MDIGQICLREIVKCATSRARVIEKFKTLLGKSIKCIKNLTKKSF